VIRLASIADAGELARLHALCFPEPWTETDMASLLSSIGVLAFIADDGFILVRAVAGEAEVLTLAVAPDARRKGQGRALVEAAATTLLEQADTLFLEVAMDNVSAQALYTAAGFEPAGRRAGYYRRAGAPSVDALVLRRTLTPSAP
jgi:ribosomal-protein-alanine N-acetyltransferase